MCVAINDKLYNMRKKLLIGLGVILVIMLITNPSIKDFEEYENSRNVKREYNFFVCSIFKHYNDRYLGILGNFFELKERKEYGYAVGETVVTETEVTEESITEDVFE
jgi:hypothetical protein